MAYGTKYYALVTLKDGSVVRLLVQQKDYSGSTYRMANVQGLSLEIGGGSDPIYTPIVKTTLRFTLVDAYDIGNSSAIANGAKNGRWEEFYTNDATKYKVILRWEPSSGSGGPSRSDAEIWQGFITPDNWQEEMYYRGSITVTARDMLGALSDYDFDDTGTNGLIKVRDLITHAVAKCGAAMPVHCTDAWALQTAAGTSIFDTYLPLKAFAGRTWWDALSDTLEGLGMVLRYDGDNGLVVGALRYLPTILSREQHGSGVNSGCEFINRSGFRQLDPPVKEISGEFRADIEETRVNSPAMDDYSPVFNVPVIFKLNNTGGWSTDTAKGAFLNSNSGGWAATETGKIPTVTVPLQKPTGGYDSDSPYFICNAGQPLLIGKRWNYCQAKTISGQFRTACRIRIAQDGALVYRWGGAHQDNFLPADFYQVKLAVVRVYISDGDYFYNGVQWVQGSEKQYSGDTTAGSIDPVELEFSNGVAVLDVPVRGDNEGAAITVNIVHVEIDGYLGRLTPPPIYAPLAVMVGEPEYSREPNDYLVKTVYNEDYNVRIDRTPAIGSVDTVLPGLLFKNVLTDANGVPVANSWKWSGMSSGFPLEVMIQAQLLQLYAASLSIFTGTFHDRAYPWAIPGSSYVYYERPCVLMRGTYDFITGYVRDVALREYMTWTEVWGSNFNPQYTIDEERISGGGGSSSGGSSGGGGGGGGGSRVSWQTDTEGDTTIGLSVNGISRNLLKSAALDFPGNDKIVQVADDEFDAEMRALFPLS